MISSDDVYYVITLGSSFVVISLRKCLLPSCDMVRQGKEWLVAKLFVISPGMLWFVAKLVWICHWYEVFFAKCIVISPGTSDRLQSCL